MVEEEGRITRESSAGPLKALMQQESDPQKKMKAKNETLYLTRLGVSLFISIAPRVFFFSFSLRLEQIPTVLRSGSGHCTVLHVHATAHSCISLPEYGRRGERPNASKARFFFSLIILFPFDLSLMVFRETPRARTFSSTI